jgi:hypothetical protein
MFSGCFQLRDEIIIISPFEVSNIYSISCNTVKICSRFRPHDVVVSKIPVNDILVVFYTSLPIFIQIHYRGIPQIVTER